MPGHGVIPAIRVRDMAAGLEFYVDRLGFTLERGGATDDNSSIARGDARLMIEVAGDLYSPGYNEAIRQRLGAPSAMALYMEASDLDALYARLEASGVEIVDPLADRPGDRASSPSPTRTATGSPSGGRRQRAEERSGGALADARRAGSGRRTVPAQGRTRSPRPVRRRWSPDDAGSTKLIEIASPGSRMYSSNPMRTWSRPLRRSPIRVPDAAGRHRVGSRRRRPRR